MQLKHFWSNRKFYHIGGAAAQYRDNVFASHPVAPGSILGSGVLFQKKSFFWRKKRCCCGKLVVLEKFDYLT